VHSDGTKDLAWFGPDGAEMDHGRWHDPSLRTLQMYLHAVVPDGSGAHEDPSLLVVVQGATRTVDVRLPGRPWAQRYELLWDSAFDGPPGHPRGPRHASVMAGRVVPVDPVTLRVYATGPGSPD
jgi:glycogen operon protein